MSDKEKILIADDSAMNRAILTEMLGDGYEILEAENGRQAVAILQSATDIDLLLLDIMMPEMDGFEVLAMMNKYHWIDEVPVIMISAENASSYVERAYDLGATDYISRPFDMAVVRRRVINTLMLYAKQKRLVRLVAEQVYEKEKSNSTTINILSHIVEFRNGESGMHVLHIQTATDILLHTLVQKTDKYHLTAADISLISTASALHDIGKINIPESILNKPGRLTKEEFEVMKTHTTIGSEILEKLPFQQESDLVKTAYAICRWHHERWDGRGYPDGLKGEQIPIAAQVVSLADVYDALTSERCYKKAFDHDTAVKMILNGECGQFNPLLLECLTECGAQLHAELSIASDTGNQLHRLADAQHISDALLRENALPGQNHIVQSLSRMQQKGRFFNQSVRCIQFDYDEPTGHLSFSAWAAEHMGVPKDLHLPDEVEETGFALADIARIQKALRATSAEHPYTELSMLLPIDGELRWHHVRLCSLWSDDSVPAYIGAAGQADPAEQFFDYHHDLYHDVLTNAYNRRFFEKQLRKLMEVDAIAMLDLDQFKQINDVYGHQAGDDALRILVSAVTACVRNRSDALVRYGGDEFLLLLPGVEQAAFATVLGDIQRRLRTVSIPGCEGGQHITISVGCVMAQQETIAQAVQRADRLMYRAKRRKDAVVTEDTPVEGDEIKPHILVVDDAAMNRAILREMLAEDFNVLEAKDGRECMAQLETYGADISLVLLDMIMPEMDGLQVLEEMNNRGFIEDIPVIIITADGSEEKVRQAYDMGVSDYIERPFDIRIVRQRVMNTVKLYARQRRLAAVMMQQLRRQEHMMGIAADILSRGMGYRNGEGADHGRHVEHEIPVVRQIVVVPESGTVSDENGRRRSV